MELESKRGSSPARAHVRQKRERKASSAHYAQNDGIAPVCTRRMARREPSMFAGHSSATTPARESGALGTPVLCPYESKVEAAAPCFSEMRGARPGKPGRQTAGASSRTPHGRATRGDAGRSRLVRIDRKGYTQQPS